MTFTNARHIQGLSKAIYSTIPHFGRSDGQNAALIPIVYMLRDHVPSPIALNLGPKICPVSFPGVATLPTAPAKECLQCLHHRVSSTQDLTRHDKPTLTHTSLLRDKTVLDLAECKSCGTVRVKDCLCW